MATRARTIPARNTATVTESSLSVAAGTTAATTETATSTDTDTDTTKETVAMAAAVQSAPAALAETVQERLAVAQDAAGRPARAFKEGMTKTMKTAEEVVAFGQGNVEALVKSGQIWSTGMQDLSKQMAASAQASYEEALAAFKALTTVKSLKEAVDLQVGFARAALEKSMVESSKYTDASLKLAEQAIAPISTRMTLAVEKFTKSA